VSEGGRRKGMAAMQIGGRGRRRKKAAGWRVRVLNGGVFIAERV
jgi:hypothetical protein